MTRLLTCGYETGDLAEAGANNVLANGQLSVVNSNPTPRAGAFCLRTTALSSTANQASKVLNLGVTKTEVWVRFAFYAHPGATTAEVTFAVLNDATPAAQTSLTYNPTDGLVRLYRGSAGTLLGTASTSFAADTWHVIDWRTQLLTTTTGNSEVWLDGNRVINFSGDNSNTTTLNMQTLQLGMQTAVASTAHYVAFDDIAVNDTAGTINNGRAGDGRVVLLMPNGAGSSTQFIRGGTDTGANYSQVNEIPPSIAQYVSSATVGNRDLYALADIPVAVSSINCVEAIALAQNSDAGGGSLAPTVKSGATTNEATPIGLTTSPGYVTARWEVDPNTSAAWTLAAVNALEAGATVR